MRMVSCSLITCWVKPYSSCHDSKKDGKPFAYNLHNLLLSDVLLNFWRHLAHPEMQIYSNSLSHLCVTFSYPLKGSFLFYCSPIFKLLQKFILLTETCFLLSLSFYKIDFLFFTLNEQKCSLTLLNQVVKVLSW